MFRKLLCVSMFLMFAPACWRHAAESAHQELPSNELRTYQIPAGHQKDVERMLDVAFYPNSVVSSSGVNTVMIKARPAFAGGLMVLSAPSSIQDGVAELIKGLDGKPVENDAKTIEVTYWLVVGHPAEKEAVDPQLTELQVPLKELGRIGTFRFEVLERLQLGDAGHQKAKLQGRHAAIEQIATMDGDRVKLELELDMVDMAHPIKFQTSLRLKPEQFGVLGQVGWDPSPQTSTSTGPSKDASKDILFAVARARLVE